MTIDDLNEPRGTDSWRGRAACLAIGSELLGSHKLDKNSLEITAVLARFAYDVAEKRIVGDDVLAVAAAVRDLLDRSEVVVVTGGLGPTADDVTREGVARALGRGLAPDQEIERWLRDRYQQVGRTMPELCRSMARVVEGSKVLLNDRGAAPGILVHEGERILAVFPGVPWEMRDMLKESLIPEIERRAAGRRRESRTLLLGGVLESEVEGRIRHLYDRFGRHDITILASFGVLRLVLSARGSSDEVECRLEEMEYAFRDVLGDDVAGVDVAGLADVVVAGLIDRGMTVATAESCTGGLVGAAVTDVAGASQAYVGGVVCYSNEVKESAVGVPHAVLVEHGAVSEPVARAMAEGVRRRLGADWGVGVTGIAGPSGGTAEKPVGLVHWAVAGPTGVEAAHRVFSGDRDVVRSWSMNAVLDMLRRSLPSEGMA